MDGLISKPRTFSHKKTVRKSHLKSTVIDISSWLVFNLLYVLIVETMMMKVFQPKDIILFEPKPWWGWNVSKTFTTNVLIMNEFGPDISCHLIFQLDLKVDVAVVWNTCTQRDLSNDCTSNDETQAMTLWLPIKCYHDLDLGQRPLFMSRQQAVNASAWHRLVSNQRQRRCVSKNHCFCFSGSEDTQEA